VRFLLIPIDIGSADVQMDQVTAGSCGVGSQCLVGAVDRLNAGEAFGVHDTSCDGCFISIGNAFGSAPSGGGGGGLFVVNGEVLQRGGAGFPGGGCTIAPC
jgi:hypothetical protein